jgi:hypothetical protein
MGIAICLVAAPDKGSEIWEKITGRLRDLRNKNKENINDLVGGIGKSSAEKASQYK